MTAQNNVFESAVNEAASQLGDVTFERGFAFVNLPMYYPGGTGIVIQVAQHRDMYMVSDYGHGSDMADMMGASKQYAKVAHQIAENYGVGFDQHTFFHANASATNLAWAIALIGGCSKEAVDLATLRLSEKKEADKADFIIGRLTKVFAGRKITEHAAVRGDSLHEWHCTALVEDDTHQSVFEFVKPHSSSVYKSVTMFHDLARKENAPKRIAIVDNKQEMKSNLVILSQAASIIESSVSDEVLAQVA